MIPPGVDVRHHQQRGVEVRELLSVGDARADLLARTPDGVERRVAGERDEGQPQHAAARVKLGDGVLVDGVDAVADPVPPPLWPARPVPALHRPGLLPAGENHHDALDRGYGLPGRDERAAEVEEGLVLDDAPAHELGERVLELDVQRAQLTVDAQAERLVEPAFQRCHLGVEPADDLDGALHVHELDQRLGVLADDVAQGDVGVAHGLP